MKIREVMTEGAECTRPDATIQQAATRMKELDVGSLPVCENDRLIGIVTDRDIVLRSVSQGHNPGEHHVKEAMSNKLHYCREDQDVGEVADLMKREQIRRVPVLDGGKRLVGIVALGDLAVHVRDDEMVGDALEEISEPAMPRR